MGNFDGLLSNNNPDFNMAVMFVTRLDKLLGERDEARIKGELLLWYRCLSTIYTNIYFKVVEKGNEEAEKEIKDKFDEIEKNFIESIKFKQNSPVYDGANERILNELDKKLNVLMYEYGLIFPKKKESKPGEAIKEVFGP